MGIIGEEDKDGEDTKEGAGRVYESSRKQANAVKGAGSHTICKWGHSLCELGND